jgi:hypothetical protein
VGHDPDVAVLADGNDFWHLLYLSSRGVLAPCHDRAPHQQARSSHAEPEGSQEWKGGVPEGDYQR